MIALGFTIHIFNLPICLQIISCFHGKYKDLTTVDSHFLPFVLHAAIICFLNSLCCLLNSFLFPFYPNPASTYTWRQLLKHILSLHQLAFSGILYGWNHIVCSLFGLVFTQHNILRLIHVVAYIKFITFYCLVVHYILQFIYSHLKTLTCYKYTIHC